MVGVDFAHAFGLQCRPDTLALTRSGSVFMKKVAILQSNYIPWKGYFDLIASVDEFVLYDEVQFTKNDWRNRNLIKTPRGPNWLSIPVGPDINRQVKDVELPAGKWPDKHWLSLKTNYARAPFFKQMAVHFEPIFLGQLPTHLHAFNRLLITKVCDILRIPTLITSSEEYRLEGDRNARLAAVCAQSGADVYVSGPSAKTYLDESVFGNQGIRVEWFDYSGYPVYPQLWGPFEHAVSVLDLLFNCGPEASAYMLFTQKIVG